MDLINCDIEKIEISPEEQARLQSLSPNRCPYCFDPMRVGDEEAFGVCAACVDLAYILKTAGG